VRRRVPVLTCAAVFALAFSHSVPGPALLHWRNCFYQPSWRRRLAWRKAQLDSTALPQTQRARQGRSKHVIARTW
jgi:hypothetical protein